MTRTRPIALACLSAALLAPTVALALASDLEAPSIAIPADGGVPDPVVERLQKALTAHAKDYTGGFMLNAQSTLHFRGGTRGINGLLDDLAKVDGATVFVHLAKGPGVTRFFRHEGPPCSCTVEHIGAGAGRTIRVTIHLGAEGVDPESLNLPAIRGH